MQLRTAALALGLVVVLAPAGDARAQSTKAVTGIDRIHAQARVGAKICMTTHEHYGEGTLSSRKGAEGAAIRAWQVFTADEYGTAWGSYALAAGKQMSCAEGGAGWICKTTARPCRPAR